VYTVCTLYRKFLHSSPSHRWIRLYVLYDPTTHSVRQNTFTYTEYVRNDGRLLPSNSTAVAV